jgi:predicted RNA-binding protein with PIN domain
MNKRGAPAISQARLYLFAEIASSNQFRIRLELATRRTPEGERGMAYIVDGNNVMGQTPGWHRDKSKARLLLLKNVAGFARAKKTRVTVVFDGEPDRAAPEGSAVQGVKVLYAERGSDADTRIERLVETSADPRGLTIVTSDRRLAFVVRALGARVIRSGEFRKQIENTHESAPMPEDGEQFEVGDVNAWMRYFGSLPEDEMSDE